MQHISNTKTPTHMNQTFPSLTTLGRVSFFNWSCNSDQGRKKTGPKRRYNRTILHTVCIASHQIRCLWNHPKAQVTTVIVEVHRKASSMLYHVIRWGLWFHSYLASFHAKSLYIPRPWQFFPLLQCRGMQIGEVVMTMNLLSKGRP